MPMVKAADKVGWHRTLNTWKKRYIQRMRDNINKHIRKGWERKYVREILKALDHVEKVMDKQRYV